MKSGALDALLGELRTSEIDFFSPSAVERWIERAFAAGKQVAFSAALHECDAEVKRYAISMPQYDAALMIAQAVERRWKLDVNTGRLRDL